MNGSPAKVIQLASFRKSGKKLFSPLELEALVEFLCSQPEKGNVIPGTNGLRKLRWAVDGRGKRGGSRIIYYYHQPEYLVLLLTAYAKNQQEDLSAKDKKALRQIVEEVLFEE